MIWGDASHKRDVAGRLRHLRYAKGHGDQRPWEEWERLTGIAQTTWSNWENPEDSKLPSLKEAAKIVASCSVSLDWIFYGREGDVAHRTIEQLRAVKAPPRPKHAGRGRPRKQPSGRPAEA